MSLQTSYRFIPLFYDVFLARARSLPCSVRVLANGTGSGLDWSFADRSDVSIDLLKKDY